MTTRLKGHTEETVKRPVYVMVCDCCGAEEAQRHGWLKLTWPIFDDFDWLEGVEEGPWDLCSVACLTILAESLTLKLEEAGI